MDADTLTKCWQRMIELCITGKADMDARSRLAKKLTDGQALPELTPEQIVALKCGHPSFSAEGIAADLRELSGANQ